MCLEKVLFYELIYMQYVSIRKQKDNELQFKEVANTQSNNSS